MEWWLGLSSWIIQDGIYGDFQRGQRVELAVKFEGGALHRCAPERAISARSTNRAEYEVTGKVVLARPKLWIIDAGALLFNEGTPPDDVEAGDMVTGIAHLGVDPFIYFERLSKDRSVPALIYSWEVISIARQTAPFIETVTPAGQRSRGRDSSRCDWIDVAATDAWTDDGGHAEYVLQCRLRGDPPKRTSFTACA